MEAPGRRSGLIAPQVSFKSLETQGLEAFQSEPNSSRFGTGKQVLQKGRN
jgi:hypothetical protein